MAHSTLVTVPSTQLAADLYRADELAALLIHGCLFQSETLLTDSHVINNPALRVAMRKYPELSEVFRQGGAQVHRRDSHASLVDLYEDLKDAGAYHAGHDKAAFDNTAALELFDTLNAVPYDSQLVGTHFSNAVVEMFTTRRSRELFAASLGKNGDEAEVGSALREFVGALADVRDENGGLLRERDFHQTVRSSLPLKEKLEARCPGLFQKLETTIKTIEGAVYNTSIPTVTSASIAFSSEHKAAARLLGRPTAIFNADDRSRVLEIGSEYLTVRNLVRLTPRDMQTLRGGGGPYQRWIASLAEFQKKESPDQNDRDRLKGDLGLYITLLNDFIESKSDVAADRSPGRKAHVALSKASRRVTGGLYRNAEPLTDFVISAAESFGALSPDWRLAIGPSGQGIKSAATFAVAKVGALIEAATKDQVLEDLRQGVSVRSGIYYDLPNETAYFA